MGVHTCHTDCPLNSPRLSSCVEGGKESNVLVDSHISRSALAPLTSRGLGSLRVTISRTARARGSHWLQMAKTWARGSPILESLTDTFSLREEVILSIFSLFLCNVQDGGGGQRIAWTCDGTTDVIDTCIQPLGLRIHRVCIRTMPRDRHVQWLTVVYVEISSSGRGGKVSRNQGAAWMQKLLHDLGWPLQGGEYHEMKTEPIVSNDLPKHSKQLIAVFLSASCTEHIHTISKA